MAAAYSQSDGRTFDAAAVLVPGMTVERNNVIYGGDYTSGLLQNGDIVRTENLQGDPFYILTSDGSVISVAPHSEIFIAGGNVGYDVFQTNSGSTAVVGNAATNFTLPTYFNNYLSQLNRNVGNVVATEAPAYVPGANGYISTPYARVYNTPTWGIYDPYGAYAGGMIGNFHMVPWNSTVVISPQTITNGGYIAW